MLEEQVSTSKLEADSNELGSNLIAERKHGGTPS